jgi:hypothetical protein
MGIEFIQHWLPTAISAGLLTLIWGDMRSTKRQLSDMVAAMGVSLRNALYASDGRTNYMPRLSCEREQARCQNLTCGKMEAISTKMDLMDARRETAKEQQQTQMGEIRQALAVLSERVEQLSQDMVQRNYKGE